MALPKRLPGALPGASAGAGGTVSYPKPLPSLGQTGVLDYDPRYGGIPTVPSPIASAGAAITGNIGNLGGLYNLAGGINQFQNEQAVAPYIANLPGYQSMIGQQSQNIGSELQGKLPQDVINQITEAGAERGIATGTEGSPNANANFLQSLGLNSLQLQEQGASDLQRSIAETPNPGLFNPASMLVSPEQQQQATAAQHLYLSSPIPSQAAGAAQNTFQQGAAFGGRATPSWGGGGRAPAWGGASAASTPLGADPFNIPGEIGPVGTTQTDSFTPSPVSGISGIGNWTFNPQAGGWTNTGTGQSINAPPEMAGQGDSYISDWGMDSYDLPSMFQ